MAFRGRGPANWPVLLLLLAVGGIIGSALGQLLVKIWPDLKIFGEVYSIGLPAFTVDLQVFTFTLGFMLNLSIFTILGFIVAYFAFRKI